MIQLDRVSKQFDGRRKVTALDGVTFDVARGEMVSIVGPSGSGKSTLLNLIGGLDRPTSGDVRVDGQLLGSLGDDDLTRVRRDKIGFIFQFFNLLPSLSCLENVALPLHLRGWPRRKADDRARELLDLVQLGRRLEHLPDELVGRRTPAGGDCARALHLPAHPARRRTDRQPRHSHGHGDSAARRGPARAAGRHHSHRHPRHARGGELCPHRRAT